MVNVFIIGSKGIPAKYGGFETFVHKLTEKRKDDKIKYYVSCLAKDEEEFIYNDAKCFNVNVADLGSAKAVLYDIQSMKKCISYIKKNKLQNCIIYVLACRIGPFVGLFKNELKKLNIKLYVNPDGHEWKRSKWNKVIREYWKLSERLMVKHADLLVCDSKAIEAYIKEDYKQYKPKTTFIAYGADVKPSELDNNEEKLDKWHKENNVSNGEYYLIVGRFVPENNFEIIIKEFMESKTNKDLVIISNVEKNKFYSELLERTKFDRDKRIKFVGTVYDEALLQKIRENAYAYIHGHEVGGTNPSLLEALASTNLNILLDVPFNREVGLDGAVYFDKEKHPLSKLINRIEGYSQGQIKNLGKRAKERILNSYSWEKIVSSYESLFLNDISL